MPASGTVAVFSIVSGCLVATPLRDLDKEGVHRFHSELSARLRAEPVTGVVLDISVLDVMDEQDFTWVRNTLHLAEVMGRRSVLAAMAPEVAATLVRLGVNVDGIDATRTVEQGIALLVGAAA